MAAPCQSPEQLIQECQGLVRSLAMKIHRKLPRNIDPDDLIGYGQVGLAEAARDFDPSRGSQFSTYAYYRIRGAIYDGVAKMTWFSRAQYNRIRYHQMAEEVLADQATAEASAGESSIEADARWFRNLTRALAIVYLTTHRDPDEDEQVPVVDTSTPAPDAVVMDRETGQKLRELVAALPEDERTLIRATYFEGETLQDAGKRLGVSKSWASRLHAKTLQRLARSLRQMGIGI